MKNRYQLRQYLRFQLEQMSAKNEHHLFEELVFELARQTISRRLVPATGPVQAGGDQGRDIESYRTHLARTPISAGLLTSMEGGKVLVFGCTLDKQLVKKIKADIALMCGSDPKPNAIYYYAVPDLPVAKRHELQRWCVRKYGASLEIFDGQAIANLLAEPEHFWIAEQFLAVPAEMYPPVEADAEYAELRERWLSGDRGIESYSDFLEVKRALRKATFNAKLKPDLGQWMSRLETIVGSQDGPIRRKALYEIAVAQLRGRGVLDPAEWAVEQFFSSFADVSEPTPDEVENATLLASYAVSAVYRGDYSGPLEKAAAWAEQARAAIDKSLFGDLNDGSRYRLLLVRGHLDFDSPEAEEEDGRAEVILRYWEDAATIAESSPFADIDALTGLLEVVIPVVGDHPRYLALADRVDAIVAGRSGKAVGAEQGRKRALHYLKADRLTLAVDQLQRAKEGWYAAETMRGSVLAMLQLAEVYLTLHLPLAARYYGAAAMYSIGNANRDELRPLVSEAAFLVANSYLLNGEVLSYLAAAGSAAALHIEYAPDPEELERQPSFTAVLAQAAQTRAVISQIAPELLPHAEAIIDAWPIDPSYARTIRELSGKPPWNTMSQRKIEEMLAEQSGQGLFADVGSVTRYQWQALGIVWSIEADASARIDAERIGAVLQIALVDLADQDLLIIPSDVHIRIRVTGSDPASLVQVPDNGILRFIIRLPAASEPTDEAARTMAMVATMIVQASAMPFEEYRAMLEAKMKRGLTARAFWVQPVSRLLRDMQSLMLANLPDLNGEPAPKLAVPQPLVHPELAWRDDLAPGYSVEKARVALTNRYSRTAAVARVIVPQLMADPAARLVLEGYHRAGMPDWQLFNVIYNFTLNAAIEEDLGGPLLGGTPDPDGVMRRGMDRIESGDIPKIDIAKFNDDFLTFQLKINVMATLKSWGLELHRQTPDSAAIKRFLDLRYRNSSDDIPHEDFFGWETNSKSKEKL